MLQVQQQQQHKQEQEQQEQEEEEEEAQKCDKKMCYKLRYESTSYCALHLRACAEHMTKTNAHTTIHNPYDIASAQSSTINIYIYAL